MIGTILQINTTHEVILVPKDRSRDPFTCYSREWKVDYEDAMNANEVTHGWCGTCDPSAGEKGRVLS